MRLVVAFAVALFSAPAFAADTPAAPAPAPVSCDAPEFHQMDFWLGTWKLTWDGGQGINRVTRTFNDCVILENFTEDSGDKPPVLHGMSVTAYHALNKMWRQTWVDDQNGVFFLTGGPKPDGTFVLQIIRVGREPEMLRMVFQDIKPDSFTWRWQGSEEGDVWTDKRVVHYARVK